MRIMSFATYLNREAKKLSHDLRGATLEKRVKKNERLLHIYCLYVLFSRDFILESLSFFERYESIHKQLLYFYHKYQKFKELSNLDELDEKDFLYILYTSYYEDVYKKEIKKKEYLSELHIIMQKKGISNYRVYTDLNLNPGNANDFLRNGSLKKMSYQNVKRILEYCSNY